MEEDIEKELVLSKLDYLISEIRKGRFSEDSVIEFLKEIEKDVKEL